MLKITNNIYLKLIVLIYIVIVLIEVFHFVSDVYLIIMSESFLCFSILLYIVSFILQEMYVSSLNILATKYNYINFLFKKIINIKTIVFYSFLNKLNYYFLYLSQYSKSLVGYYSDLLVELFYTVFFFKKEELKKKYIFSFSLNYLI